MKGAFFSCGQNCAGAERFFVQEAVYDDFVNQVAEVTKRMRQGPALGGGPIDCGAMCMPGLAEKVADLVDDAVQHGAKVHLHLPYQNEQKQSLCLLAIMIGTERPPEAAGGCLRSILIVLSHDMISVSQHAEADTHQKH